MHKINCSFTFYCMKFFFAFLRRFCLYLWSIFGKRLRMTSSGENDAIANDPDFGIDNILYFLKITANSFFLWNFRFLIAYNLFRMAATVDPSQQRMFIETNINSPDELPAGQLKKDMNKCQVCWLFARKSTSAERSL